MISSNEDVQQYLFWRQWWTIGTRERLLNQFKTILDGRSDIRNLGIIGSNGRKLINDGKQSVNPDLKLSTHGVVSGSFTEAGRPASYIFSCTAHHQRRASVGDHFKQGNP